MAAPDASSDQDNELAVLEKALEDLDEVYYTDADMKALFGFKKPIQVTVHSSGLNMHAKHGFIRRYIDLVESSNTMSQTIERAKQLQERFYETGLFRSVTPRIEPAVEGGNNIVVCVDVDESPGRKEAGISTDMAGSPEIKLSWANLFHRPYTGVFEFLPTNISRSVTSITAKVLSFDPWIGRVGEYSFFQGNYDHGARNSVDAEVRAEGKVAVHFGPTNHRHTVMMAAQRSQISSRTPQGVIPTELLPYLDDATATRTKISGRYEGYWSSLRNHTHPILHHGYAHPISGGDVRVRVESCGGILGGDVKHTKFDISTSRHWLLHPFLTLGVWARSGYIMSDNDVHALDRFFLNGNYVRGYKYVGPYAVTGVPNSLHDITNWEAKGGKGKRVVDQLGGNFYAALSASLGFPLPTAGLLAGHIFLNTGTVQNVKNIRQISTSVEDWSTSFGLGILVNQVPLIGPMTFGRIEFNCSIPLVHGSGKTLPVWKPNPRIFDRTKFGLNWVAE